MNRVKELREELGVKQKEMAELLKQSQANYNKKENGKVRFTITEAKTVADFFHKTVDEIFLQI